MTWMFALKAILSLLSALLKRAEVRREEALRIEGKRIGRLEAFVEQAQDAERIVKDIENVRREFRRRIDALPDSLRDDDGHRRD